MQNRLTELIYQRQDCGLVHNSKGQDFVVYNASLAAHLIANGVVLAKDDKKLAGKWIPVAERLPEEPLQTVLVTNGTEVCVGTYSIIYEEFGVMCGRKHKRFGVTHWMPLPEPPKEVE